MHNKIWEKTSLRKSMGVIQVGGPKQSWPTTPYGIGKGLQLQTIRHWWSWSEVHFNTFTTLTEPSNEAFNNTHRTKQWSITDLRMCSFFFSFFLNEWSFFFFDKSEILLIMKQRIQSEHRPTGLTTDSRLLIQKPPVNQPYQVPPTT